MYTRGFGTARTRISGLVFTALAAVMVIPWHSSVEVPALWQAAGSADVFAPDDETGRHVPARSVFAASLHAENEPGQGRIPFAIRGIVKIDARAQSLPMAGVA